MIGGFAEEVRPTRKMYYGSHAREVNTNSPEYLMGCRDGARALAREIARECLGTVNYQGDRPRDIIKILKVMLTSWNSAIDAATGHFLSPDFKISKE